MVVDDIVDAFEKPEQLLRQAIRDMQGAFDHAVDSTAQALAAEKRLRQQLSATRDQARHWHERALHAIQGQNEEAARRALAHRIEGERAAETLAEQLLQSEESTRRLRNQLETLRNRLGDAKRSLNSLIARQRAAEARRRFVKTLGQFNADVAAFRRFEELSQRVEQSEAEADAHEELCGVDFDEPSNAREIEAALQALKIKSPSP